MIALKRMDTHWAMYCLGINRIKIFVSKADRNSSLRQKIFVAAIFCALSFFSLYTPCRAGAPTAQVQRMLDLVMSIQTDPQLQGEEFRNKRRLSVKKIIAESFDFDAMAEQSLSRFWQDLDGAQRAEFKNVFQDLFQDSYTRLVLNFLKREEIHYTKETVNEGRALVKTAIIRTNDEIPVNYFLAPVEKEWLVHDVEIDGVSIVKNYQTSFNRVIKRESYESLLQKMLLQRQTIEKTS